MNIRVLDNINHNGKGYKSGDIMNKVSKKDAERLINLGAAEEVEASDEYTVDEDLDEGEANKEDSKKNK